ncbi:hypothetical protein GPECTOR_12g371 [Gonium pectorale]|uniref:Right handed beta helix domain-containing protein n=1 Tax=Gonium pectorale TaxID=33097 RepID=A0A150GNK8_GONPE|nr:hypothetical protein GPECTOR_12g371 [Gonium pectorale]|eukprot:KXZ51409.1 hypothetical protein GPECTOR_12g371 [Gonium pectorale]
MRQADPSPDEEEAFAWVSPQDGNPSSSSSSPEPGPGAPPARRRFGSLGEAVAACPPGGVVLVAAGRYRERLVLTRPLTIRAWPPGAPVEVVWETKEPYQSTVEGLTIRHASKSVANNYGVFIKSGSPLLEGCDVSSTTGAGVGVEGASPRLLRCVVHDCARQGIAIFGAVPDPYALDPDLSVDPGLVYGMTGGVVRDCEVKGNALDGVLVRGGASPDLMGNRIHHNAGFGVNLQDCAGRYERNAVYDNARGAVLVSPLFELEPGDLAGSNSLRGLLRRL